MSLSEFIFTVSFTGSQWPSLTGSDEFQKDEVLTVRQVLCQATKIDSELWIIFWKQWKTEKMSDHSDLKKTHKKW